MRTGIRKHKKLFRYIRRDLQKGRIVARSFSQASRVMMYELMLRVFGEGITCSQTFFPFCNPCNHLRQRLLYAHERLGACFI